MSSERVTVWPLVSDQVQGESVVAAYGPLRGGYIYNPADPVDQGLSSVANLFVDITGPAAAQQTSTTSVITPGNVYSFPPGLTGAVWVNSQSVGHRFSGAIYQPWNDFKPSVAPFPPAGLTSILSTLPQYLYEEYADDETLLGFVQAFNEIVQSYVDYYNALNLPVFTLQQGRLLDWVADGMYGFKRPALPQGVGRSFGPYNTSMFNTIGYNVYDLEGPSSFYATTDDVFKRILTWYTYKGDGKQFNVRWIKRRVERFLSGTDGGGGNSAAGSPSTPQMYPPDNTYEVGVTFGTDGQININLQTVVRHSTGGALYNVAPYNAFPFNDFETEAVALPSNPMYPIFKSAVDSGVLAFPFQLQAIVNLT